jgi:ABC-type multidrug transport system fused ATPase/permease subunit
MKQKTSPQKNSIEWQPLKMPIFLFLVGLIIAILMVFISSQYNNKIQEKFSRTETSLKELQKRNEESQKNLTIVKTAYPQYQHLKTLHFFDNETASLNWVSWLKTLQENIKISELNYEFNMQQPITIPILDKKNNGVEFFSSEIKLNIQILHLGDLFNLISGLRKYNQSALFDLKSCDIKRKHPVNFVWQQHSGQPLLEAVCSLQWYSAKLKPQDTNK